MTVEKLNLKHKELIQSKFSVIAYQLSEFCFSNLYLFRDKHEYEVITEGSCMFIKGKGYDGKTFMMPGCNLLKPDCHHYLDAFINFLDEVDMLFPIPERWLDFFPTDMFKVELLLDDLDYVFNKEKLSLYPGRKLQKKRNLVHQFLNNYESNFEVISTKKHIEDAKLILEKWQEESNYDDKKSTDFFPCLEALDLIKELELFGLLYYVNDNPVGFTLGEKISDKTFGLHFAKGLKDIKGIYQYMFSTTAQSIDSKYEFVNLEQDLGQEALRATKSSYLPDLMARKYRIIKK